jgi:glycosyltransferase involved in cell wall biosynthesis
MILVARTVLNANTRNILHALNQAKLLHSVHTTYALSTDSTVAQNLPTFLASKLQRREIDLPSAMLRLHPADEFARQFLLAIGSTWTQEPSGHFSAYQVGARFDRAVAQVVSRDFRQLTAVYAYEDAARAIFQSAKANGLKRIYELPIAYWQTSRELLKREIERYPTWAQTIGDVFDEGDKPERKTEEAELADMIVCPSEFVASSLPESLRRKSVVAKYGSETAPPQRPDDEVGAVKLRVLFAGTLTQRKGLADLFQAMKLLPSNQIDLIVCGTLRAPLQFYRSEYEHFTYEPPRDRKLLLHLMSQCDVLVLPSIVEGRALVVQEAMMCGLPIIVTPNSGCDDLVLEGETGFVVPIRAPEAIADRLTWFINNKQLLAQMRMASRTKAAEVSWISFQQSILSNIESLQSSRTGA